MRQATGWHYPSLVRVLRKWAEVRSAKIAVRFLADGEQEQDRLTFSELDRRARSLAVHLLERSAPGERALLLYQPGIDFVVGFLGCLYSGLIAVPTTPPRSRRTLPRLLALAEDSEPSLILTDARMAATVEGLEAKIPGFEGSVATDEIGDELADDWRDQGFGSDDLAFLQYTSGSTASPKGVMVSHGNLVHNVHTIAVAMDLFEQTVFVSWLPLFHDMGLIAGLLKPLYLGTTTVLMSPAAFVQQPRRWLEAISRYRATVSGGPNFAYELCLERLRPEDLAELDLASWRVAFNGAEPIRAATIERFVRAFEPCGFRPETMFPCYGLAECTLFVTSAESSAPPVVETFGATALESDRVRRAVAGGATGRALVSAGYRRLDQRVAIVDPETRTLCLPDRVGEIWLAGPSVAQGYWRRPETTEEDFQATLVEPADDGYSGPFLRTGDLGFLDREELFVTGRLKDLLIIRGRNLYPQDLELTTAGAHPALRPDAVAAFSLEIEDREELVVVQEVHRSFKGDPATLVDAIRQALAEEHEVEVYDVALVRHATISKTSSGKIQRQASRAAYLNDELKVVYRWRQDLEPMAAVQASTDGAPADGASVTDDATVTDVAEDGAARDRPAVLAWLRSRLGAHLGVAPRTIDVHRPFSAHGLDSRATIEMAGRLEDWLGRSLSPTLLYDHPTVASLADHLSGVTPARRRSAVATPAAGDGAEPIAIVGIGCRFPGAEGPQAFWRLLRDGVDAVSEVPEGRWNAADYYHPTPGASGRMSTRWGGFLDDVDRFDAEFFAIAPREARGMDPQQRLLLEVAWQAFEDAGQLPADLAGHPVGVFVGISGFDYGHLWLQDARQVDSYTGTGSALSIAANRLSYVFDLVGPSLAIDTACSSSLVAVHLAMRSLRAGECTQALAGGVNLLLTPEPTIGFSHARMMAADGRCKTFSAEADGYVRGEGCGLVVLKPLSAARADGDRIYAVLRGSAVNQDGRSNGLTAPSGASQQEVIRRALADAAVAPAEIDLVEAHGTGTPLGDPIELEALAAVVAEGREPSQTCRVGSVKTNIGHLESAAGVAGLIKVALSLDRCEVPPHLHLETINPRIPMSELPLAIATTLEPWPRVDSPRRAGVSSFGFGGTNAHVVVEEAPERDSTGTARAGGAPPAVVLPLAARTRGALRRLAERYADHLEAHPELSILDVCRSAGTRRTHFDHRLAAVAGSSEDLARQLRSATAGAPAPGLVTGRAMDRRPRVAFLFTGQGSQYPGMGRELYDSEPLFREVLARCDELLSSRLDRSLLSLLYPEDGERAAAELLKQTAYAQPALFAFEIALAELWRSWGIEPDVVMGHSLGEYVAACVAGVFSLEQGLELVAERGRLMQELPSGGAMAAAFAGVESIEELAGTDLGEVSVAALNGPRNTVLSGDAGALEAVLETLAAAGVKSRRLEVSHAFHSSLMEAVIEPFAARAGGIPHRPPRVPLISNLTGAELPARIDPEAYWCAHLRQPVRFADGLRKLSDLGVEFFVEIGPSPDLCAMGRRCLPGDSGRWLASLRRGRRDRAQLSESLGELYVHGAEVDWSGLDRHLEKRRVPLPTYPFERRRFWLAETSSAPRPTHGHPLLGTEFRSAHTGGERYWQAELDASSVDRLAGRSDRGATVPATALLEMVFAAARQTFGDGPCLLEGLELSQALVLAEGAATTVQVVWSPRGDAAGELWIYSRPSDAPDAEWTLHANVRIRRGSRAA